MLNSDLAEAIKVNNTVVLPGFGGILKVAGGCMYNAFLKFNDGKFSAFLQESRSISKEEADQLISDYITAIEAGLDSEGVFALGELGELVRDDNGKVKLSSLKLDQQPVRKPEVIESKVEEVEEEEEGFLSIHFSEDVAAEKISAFENKDDLLEFVSGDRRLPVVKALNRALDEFNRPKMEPIPVKTKKPEEIQEVVEEEVVQEEIVQEEVSEVEEIEPSPIDAEEPGTEEETVVEVEKEVEPPKEERAVTPDPVNKEIEKESDTSELAPRRKRKWLRWLGVLFILNGAVTLGVLNKNYLMSLFKSEEVAERKASDKKEIENPELKRVTPPVEKDTMKEEDPVVVEDDVKPDEKIEDEEKPVVDKQRYHIMVGSFSKKEYAFDYIRTLDADGYNDAGLLGEFKGLFSVKIASFDSRDEATAYKDELKAKGIDGWVKKY